MRLLLVEDDNHVAAALSAVLARHGFEVTHARSGEEALQALLPATGAGFGVVLLDLGLPDQDGYEVCGKIRKRTSHPRDHGDRARRRAVPHPRPQPRRRRLRGQAVRHRGAARPHPRRQPAHRRTRTRRRGDARETDAAASAPSASSCPPARSRVDGDDVQLTRKEFDLLALLAQRPGVVFRREQIISEVWRTSWEGTGRTLEVHVASLRSKLRMPALIETVRGVGYRLVAPAALAGPPGAHPSPAAAHRPDGRRAARARLPARRQPGRRPAAEGRRRPDRRHRALRRARPVRHRPAAAPTRRTTSAARPCRAELAQLPRGVRHPRRRLLPRRRAHGHAPRRLAPARRRARRRDAFDEALARPPQPRPPAGLALAARPARRRLPGHPGRRRRRRRRHRLAHRADALADPARLAAHRRRASSPRCCWPSAPRCG